jgi:uncharacterized phage-associated protein
LFNERIEAWTNKPVVPELYKAHQDIFKVNVQDIKSNTDALSETQKETTDVVLKNYRPKSSQWLSSLTHLEEP